MNTIRTEIVGIFGFGSFFRTDKPSDCDLLLVVKDDSSDLGKLHADLSMDFLSLGQKLSIDFDLTILTETEHARKPLLEHENLIPILQPDQQISGANKLPCGQFIGSF